MIQQLGKPLSFLATAVAATAIALSSAGVRAAQAPVVLPLADGGGVYHFDGEGLSKFQLFNAPTGSKHAGNTMTWKYNDANRPSNVTKAAAIAQFQNSMAKWTAVCNINFAYQGETATPFSIAYNGLPASTNYDGVNVVGWVTGNITGNTTGITSVAWNGSNTFIDVEIRLNADFSFNSTALDSTITHEVGHALGLQHSDVENQVMSGPPLSSYNGRTALNSDDIAGCVSLYGAPGGGGGPLPDTTPPSVPTTVIAAAISQTAIALTWNASTDNVGVTSYNIYRSNGSLLGTVSSPGANVTSLTPGTLYSFTVSACDAAGNCSAQSAPASATTQAPVVDTQAPSIPTSLNGTGVSVSQINLTWSASTDNVGVTSYKVFRSGTQVGTVSSTSTSVTGLAASTMYSFTVSACDAAGNCSAQSSPASATTLAAGVPDTQAPTTPTNLVATAANSSSINLSWSASTDNVGVNNYRVFRSGVQIGTVSGTSTAATGLSPSTLYSFTVQACDAAGNCSAQSTQATATTLSGGGSGDTEPPSVPLNLVANTVNSSTVVLSWFGSVDNGPGTVTYRLFRDGTFVSEGITSNAAVYNLAASTTYVFTVQACDVAGNCSAFSDPATARTLAGTNGGPGPTSYQDLWWAPGQNGWGLTITQHNDALFIAMYVYDATGKPTWVVMSSGTWDSTHTIYSGDLYVPSGSWFGNYDKNRFVVGAPAGSASFRFTSTSAAVVTYNINGLSGSKNIERLAFGVVDNTPVTNYADAWWAGTAENGWGLVLSQQYRNIFAAWYTYETSGQTTWFVMSDGTWTTPTTYSGKLYSTHGSQVLGATYNAALFGVTEVGTLTLTFSGASAGTMTYTVNGLTQTKSISRLPF